MTGLTLNWGDLARSVIGLGAPLLGQALGGPLGGAAGTILANALGTEATPAAVQGALAERSADSPFVTEATRKAEAEWATALAQAAAAEVREVGATQRAEIGSDDPLQRWWRPLYALELSLIECPAFVFVLLYALWAGFKPAIDGFATVSGLLITYFGARFGVLGVYVSGRSREKQSAATGTAVPGLIGDLLTTLVRRK